jgi:hypothetical protein
LHPIVEYMVSKSSIASTPLDMYNKPFTEMIRKVYYKFVEEKINDCLSKCRDDLHGMTRFVTWDVEDKGGASTLYRLLPTPKKMVEIYSIAVESKEKKRIKAKKEEEEAEEDEDLSDEISDDFEDNKKQSGGRNSKVPNKILDEWNAANSDKKQGGKNNNKGKNNDNDRKNVIKAVPQPRNKKENSNEKKIEPKPSGDSNSGALTAKQLEDDVELSDYYRVMQLTEEMLSGSSASRTSALVTSLVQYIICSWRNHFARSTAMKFNCFFLMPFMDDFPVYLRNELDKMCEGGVAEMFDIAETRRALQNKRIEYLAECEANSKLQHRFDQISAQLRNGGVPPGSPDPSFSINDAFGNDDDGSGGGGGGGSGGFGGSGSGGSYGGMMDSSSNSGSWDGYNDPYTSANTRTMSGVDAPTPPYPMQEDESYYAENEPYLTGESARTTPPNIRSMRRRPSTDSSINYDGAAADEFGAESSPGPNPTRSAKRKPRPKSLQ